MDHLITTHKTVMRVCDSMQTADGITIPIVDGQLSCVEEVSPNGYRYKKDFWHHVLKEQYVKDMIENRECIGTIEHPTEDDAYQATPYEDASHVCLSAVLVGDNPQGKFGLLNNNKGNALKALVDMNIPIGVSTRGMGEQLSDHVSPYIPHDGYRLITWDCVRNPNFAALRLRRPVSDSVAERLFNELTGLLQMRDSAYNGYRRDYMDNDHRKLLRELKRMLNEVEL